VENDRFGHSWTSTFTGEWDRANVKTFSDPPSDFAFFAAGAGFSFPSGRSIGA